jgi:hypothetical protein
MYVSVLIYTQIHYLLVHNYFIISWLSPGLSLYIIKIKFSPATPKCLILHKPGAFV